MKHRTIIFDDRLFMHFSTYNYSKTSQLLSSFFLTTTKFVELIFLLLIIQWTSSSHNPLIMSKRANSAIRRLLIFVCSTLWMAFDGNFAKRMRSSCHQVQRSMKRCPCGSQTLTLDRVFRRLGSDMRPFLYKWKALDSFAIQSLRLAHHHFLSLGKRCLQTIDSCIKTFRCSRYRPPPCKIDELPTVSKTSIFSRRNIAV